MYVNKAEFRTRMTPVLIRTYRCLHGDLRMHSVATLRYTVPTRMNMDSFSSVYSGMKNWESLFFSLDMPVHQGWRRMSPRWIHGDARLNKDDPRMTIRVDPRCDPWSCKSPLTVMTTNIPKGTICRSSIWILTKDLLETLAVIYQWIMGVRRWGWGRGAARKNYEEKIRNFSTALLLPSP